MTKRHFWVLLRRIFVVATTVITPYAHSADLGNLGSFEKWSKIEIQLLGPPSVGMSDNPNPFKIIVDVDFAGPGGAYFTVPAFYDGDGSGGLDGNVWRVRFSPNKTGTWTFASRSAEPALNGYTGNFSVTVTNNCVQYTAGEMPDFSCVGRLQWSGKHYLKFADGPYWLEGGANDPEDFLADEQTAGFGSKQAALDYLASKGINALYFMAHNVGGDPNYKVWPWAGASEVEAKLNNEHFDVAKLAAWESVFEYMQSKGIVMHLVFEDDSAWRGFNREMYYREIVARFGHHNGIIWNISEEYNEAYTATAVKGFAQMISDLDAYDHPLTVHNQGLLSNWQPFLGDARFGITSFQTAYGPQNPAAVEWFNRVELSGRTIPISFDEIGTLLPTDIPAMRHIAWSVFTGGANYEMRSQISTNSYASYLTQFEDITRARRLIEGLPFWQMRPANELLLSGTGYTFAQKGEAYLTYLPAGGSLKLDLSATGNNFNAKWFNPRNGGTINLVSITGGGVKSFTAPDKKDWVLVLTNAGGGYNLPPQAIGQNLPATVDTATQITLGYTDPDGPGPYVFSIVDSPLNGVLSSDDGDAMLVYTPNPGYTGGDSFTFRVNDGLSDSNLAVVTINVSEQVVLMNDSFGRADSDTLGGDWIESEATNAQVGIRSGKLVFTDTSDVVNRPIASYAFQKVSAGQLIWRYTFDWTRAGSEGNYALFMQLGDGALMSDNNQNAGVGVNLIWSVIGGRQEMLGYRLGGSDYALAPVSGFADIEVIADLEQFTFDVFINGALVQSGIPFDQDVGLDTMRFFTDGLNELNFTGRSFDNIEIRTFSTFPPINRPPIAQDQAVATISDTAAVITLDFTDSDGPGPYNTSIVDAPLNGFISSNDGDAMVVYTPYSGYTGADSFTFQVNDGLDSSNIATVTLDVSNQLELFNDTFQRADDDIVGNSWNELETAGTEAGIRSGELVFVNSSDAKESPIVSHTFQKVSAGQLVWRYEFNWERTGSEGNYALYMQLGDSALMSDTSFDAGVGVNLVWSAIGGNQEVFGYRAGGKDVVLVPLSGVATIEVSADLDQFTYDVSINGTQVQTGIPFSNLVELDTVRFFTDGLNELNFAGRSFDNVELHTTSTGTSPFNEPPIAEDKQVEVARDTVAEITMDFSDTDGPGPYQFTIIDYPVNGTLSSVDGDNLVVYTPDPGYTSADNFTFLVNDGIDDSNIATVYIDVTGQVMLLNDDFERADSDILGNGWNELEAVDTQVGIRGGSLVFIDTSDAVNRPTVSHTFQKVSAGLLTWRYQFDWARTGEEGTYNLFMQLGDSALMSENDQDGGVGINLVWSAIGASHEILAYRRGGAENGLLPLSGTATIEVVADLDQWTYDVSVNGVLVQAQIPFDNAVGLDTVRFFTDGLNELNFSGKGFDNLEIFTH